MRISPTKQIIMDATERKPGEMFTASAIRKFTPEAQFIFATLTSLIVMLPGRFMHSTDLIVYGGSFGVVFFALWNPWLALLAPDNKVYFIKSAIGYLVISLLLFGLVYLWTGLSVLNSVEMAYLLVSTTFYGIVAYMTMVGIKMLFLDLSEGGM